MANLCDDIGPHSGNRTLTLHDPSFIRTDRPKKALTADRDGFSLNAAVSCQPYQRDRLERLFGYVTRPAICLDRLTVRVDGQIQKENSKTDKSGKPLEEATSQDKLIDLYPGLNDSRQSSTLTLPYAPCVAAAPFAFPWGMIRDDTHENLIQELRLVSTTDSKLNWVVGAYYADRETDYGQDHHTVPELVQARNLAGLWTTSLSENVFIEASKRVNSDVETAFFAELSYELTDTLKLALGARVGEVEVTDVRWAEGVEGISSMIQTNLRWYLGEVGAAPRLDVYDLNVVFPQGVRPFGVLQDDGTYRNQPWAVSDNYSTAKISLTWLANDDVNLYAMAAKGFRGPQINGSSTTNGGVSLVDPTDIVIAPSSDADTLCNYEVGMKARWFDGLLDTKVSLYFIDWQDMQHQVSRVSDGGSFITNAGASESKGFEVELIALPTANLELGLNFSISDAKITELTPDQAALTGFQLGISEKLTNPDFSASAFAQYTTPVFDGNELYLRTDIQYVDGYMNKSLFVAGQPGVIDAGAEESDAYHNVNVSIGLNSQQWTASLYGENVLDSDDAIYIYPAVWLKNQYGTLRPRTFGLRLTYRM